MDTYGIIALVVLLIAFFAAAFALKVLGNRAPRWSVLVVALVIFAFSFSINVGHSRELIGVVGFLRILGLFGITYGISVFRKKGKNRPSLTSMR
jgi:predicted permease